MLAEIFVEIVMHYVIQILQIKQLRNICITAIKNLSLINYGNKFVKFLLLHL